MTTDIDTQHRYRQATQAVEFALHRYRISREEYNKAMINADEYLAARSEYFKARKTWRDEFAQYEGIDG